MTDKEKIRKEVERLRKSYQIMYQELDCESPKLMSVCAKRNLCQDILMFIDSLQEEPVSKDLEKAASSFARKDSEGISNPANFYYTVADKMRIFKAGAQWKEKQMMQNAKQSEVVITSSGILLSDLKIEDFDYEDKVKVIIIKQE